MPDRNEPYYVCPKCGLMWFQKMDLNLKEFACAETLKASKAGVIILDASGGIVAMNEEALTQTGRRWERVEDGLQRFGNWKALSEDGQTLTSTQLPPAITLMTGNPVKDMLIGVPMPDVETEYGQELGGTRWMNVNTVPIPGKDPGSRPIGVVSMMADVTDTSRGRKATNSLLSVYRLIADNSMDIVFLTGNDGLVRWVSPSLRTVTGLGEADVVGRPGLNLVHTDDVESLKMSRERINAPEGIEFKARVKTVIPGEYIWVDGRSTPAFDAAGNIVGRVSTLRSIDREVQAQKALDAAERRFSKMFHGHDAVMLLSDPKTGEIVDANLSAAAFYGYSTRALRALHMEDIVVGGRATRKGPLGEKIHAHQVSDGRTRMVEVHSSEVTENNRVLEYHVIHDVTQKLENEAQLRQAAAVFENTLEAIMQTDTRGVITRVNPAFTQITGWTPEEIIGKRTNALGSLGKVFSPGETRKQKNIESYLRAGFRGEAVVNSPSGNTVNVLISINPVKDHLGETTGYVGALTDITEVKAAQTALEFLAHNDPLTGLPNQLRFTGILEEHLEYLEHDGKGSQGAVLLMNLDRLKFVNDSYGRQAGDDLIAIISNRLKDLRSDNVTLASLGGGEFAIMLKRVSEQETADGTARRILDMIAFPCILNGEMEVFTSACIGVVLLPGASKTVGKVLQNADAALHRAKKVGPGSIRHNDADVADMAKTRLMLEMKLRRAFDANKLRVAYQPQLDMNTGRIVGVEALLRWNDEGKEISPAEFIPVAEATGMITPIGHWVLNEACRQGKEWVDAGLPPITVAVNVSARQLEREDLAEMVSEALLHSGFSPGNLELELTESALLSTGDATLNILKGLVQNGVRIALDDFGTGYSSLAYLKHFPLDKLKIDRSFVKEIVEDSDDRAIAATIVDLGRHLGLRILAEGVETPLQLAVLQGLGCQEYQGFLYSPAVTAEEIGRMLELDSGKE